VQDVVSWYEYQGMTPDEIVSHIPSITLADVHSALAYYFDHVQEIQDEIRADREYADEFFCNNPSMLDAKLIQGRLKEASWSVPVRFHLDEQIPPALADALRNRGIDVTTTADAGLIGTEDREQLAFAANEQRVVITQDVDFLRLHTEGTPHAGIAFWRQQTRSVGEALRRLLLIHAAMSPGDMKGRVEYL
jgi:hypothetical protein